MNVEYKTKQLEKYCTDYVKATRKYGDKVAEKIFAVINVLESANSMLDVARFESKNFNFHALTGDSKRHYAIYLGKKLGFRLIVSPILNGRPAKNDEIFSAATAIKIVDISIDEVTNHYE